MSHRDRRAALSPRPCRRALLPLLSLLLCAAATPAVAGEEASALRRWGFGWDPADTGAGLTVRHRFTPRWDLSVAAGPNDYRMDSESTSWDDDTIVVEDGMPSRDDSRREQGWVRLAAGGCFWREGRVTVSGIGAVTYRWSVEEYADRNFRSYNSPAWDYWNKRERRDVGTWSAALGIRPSFAVTPRLNVEFEAGLEFERVTTDFDTREWWDSYPDTYVRHESRHQRAFNTYGGFEFYKLKFLFWF